MAPTAGITEAMVSWRDRVPSALSFCCWYTAPMIACTLIRGDQHVVGSRFWVPNLGHAKETREWIG